MAGAPNFANRTMWTRDNLDVLRGLNSESIDLVYADPPFNSNKNYEAPIGSKAAGAAFKDTWTLSDVDVAWHGEIADREPRVYAAIEAAGIVQGKGMRSYLTMMAVRLLEVRRVLKPTGSLYVHCDDKADAYLRLLCDGVFTPRWFRNALVWNHGRVGVMADGLDGLTAFSSRTVAKSTARGTIPVPRSARSTSPATTASRMPAATTRISTSPELGLQLERVAGPGKDTIRPTAAGTGRSRRTGPYAAWIAEHVVPSYKEIAGRACAARRPCRAQSHPLAEARPRIPAAEAVCASSDRSARQRCLRRHSASQLAGAGTYGLPDPETAGTARSDHRRELEPTVRSSWTRSADAPRRA